VARAHANLVESEPPAGAVDAVPERIMLTFSGLLERGSEASVVDAMATPLPGVASRIDPADRSRLIVALPPGTGPGAYTVPWTSVSAEDGHDQKGYFALLAGGAASLPISPPALSPDTAAPRDLQVQLTATPDDQGIIQWAATVAGPTASTVQRVTLRFVPPLQDVGVEQMVAAWDDAAGAYVAAHPIALAGAWRTEVVVRREGVGDDARLPFAWSASLPA
jgi:methionine-rich copper-binding protein CopC